MHNLSDVRVRLDQLTEVTISGLKDRSRFPLNDSIYIPDAIKISKRPGISFLEFAAERLEACHGSLGRFNYPDQHPLFSKTVPKSLVKRQVPKTQVPSSNVSIKEELLKFYFTVLPELCRAGDDPTTHGQAAVKDAEVLELMNERITGISFFVAKYKSENNFNHTSDLLDPLKLKESLRDPERERVVIAKARETATKYELSADLIERVFRWLIEKTVDVEAIYLQKLNSLRQAQGG